MKAQALGLVLLWAFALVGHAQTQQGLVKTKGRLGNDGKVIAGTPLHNVTVKVKGRTSVVSNNRGAFSFPVPGEAYYIEKVEKKGYLLTDPDLLSKRYSYSKDNPLYVVMETPDTQLEDKMDAAEKIRLTLQRNIQQLKDEIKHLREENKISQQEYLRRMNELFSSQEKNEKLISEMAERYSRIDYDQLDEFNRRVSELILNGELAKADSLLNTKGDINARVAEFIRHREANAEEEKELAQRQEKLSKSKEYTKKELEDLAQDCYHKHEIFKTKFQNDSAAYYLEVRAELDTMNADWQLKAGAFIDTYLAAYDRALSYYQKVLRNAQQYGENHPDVATSYNNMGLVYDAQGDYAKALEYHNKALKIRLATFGENHPDVATSYNNMGLVYYSQGDYAKALEYYNKALKIWLAIFGENHPNVATSYNNMGMVYYAQGNYAKTLKYHNKALEIRLAIFGEKHPDVTISYNNMGMVYYAQSDYTKALEYYNKALKIMLAIFGENHPLVATSYNNIGSVYYSQGDYAKVLEYYNKALKIWLAIFGENHPLVATSYNNIGGIHAIQNGYDLALDYHQKALSIRLSVYGENHPDVATSYNNIGSVYYYQGDYAKALEYYNKALKIMLAIFKENHPDVATSYNNMGLVYDAQGDYAKALEYYNKVLKILPAIFGENHPDVATSYNNMGMVYRNQGDYTNALEYYNKALKIRQTIFGENHPDVATSYNNMGLVYRNQGDYTKALEYYNKTLKIRQTIFGENHPDVATSYNNIGSVYCYQGDYAKALEYYNKALKIMLAIFKENHPYTILSIINIYIVYIGQFADDKDCDKTPYRSFMSNIAFTATVVDGDYPESQQGMSGEYYLLELEDWNLDDTTCTLFDKDESLKGKPKTILVMKDGVISRHHFENTIGVRLGLRYVGKEEKTKITDAYNKWKGENH